MTPAAELDHALRGPLTVIMGETELVLGVPDAPSADRARSAATVVAAVRRIEDLLARWRATSGEEP
jgi:signal transduction histidine kinase